MTSSASLPVQHPLPASGPARAVACLTTMTTAMLALGAAAVLSTSSNVEQAAHRPATEVKPLSCEQLADVPGKSITTASITFPPSAYTPAHRHPGSVTAFVVFGAIHSQMAGEPPRVYTAGSTWFEPAGVLHLFAENPSASEPAQLLATFVADDGCASLVIPDADPTPAAAPTSHH